MSLWTRLFGPPGRDEFSRLVEAALRRTGLTGRVEYDPTEFVLRVDDDPSGKDHVLYLGNVYADYCRARRSERPEIVRRFAAILDDRATSADAAFDQARPSLLPRVVNRAYPEIARLHLVLQWGPSDEAADAMPARPFSDHLALTIVVDKPDSIQAVAGHNLRDWGVPFDDVLKAAADNLWARSKEDFRPVGPGLWLSPWQDTHDASRLFLHDLIWQLPVKGRHVAMVPNRDVLLVTGDEDADALVRMAELADQQLRAPRPLSGVAVRLDGAKWVPFLPPAGHPAHRPLRAAAVRSAATDYNDQKDLLEALHKNTGEDVFVASLTAMQRTDGTLYTWTSWVEGVTDALMPRADVVAFGREDGDDEDGDDEDGDDGETNWAPAEYADWDRVVAVAGGLMEATDLYPVRYRVRQFPTPDQLREMGVRDQPWVES